MIEFNVEKDITPMQRRMKKGDAFQNTLTGKSETYAKCGAW